MFDANIPGRMIVDSSPAAAMSRSISACSTAIGFGCWKNGCGVWCGEDKIIYGSETPLWHPQWALHAFMDFQILWDLCAGYGYPQLTEQAKRKILGENLLRLHGMDLAEAKARVVR